MIQCCYINSAFFCKLPFFCYHAFGVVDKLRVESLSDSGLNNFYCEADRGFVMVRMQDSYIYNGCCFRKL